MGCVVTLSKQFRAEVAGFSSLYTSSTQQAVLRGWGGCDPSPLSSVLIHPPSSVLTPPLSSVLTVPDPLVLSVPPLDPLLTSTCFGGLCVGPDGAGGSKSNMSVLL